MRRILMACFVALTLVRPSAGQEAAVASRPSPQSPQIEAFLLLGATHRGAIIEPQRHSFPRQFALELGAALHFALGRHWAAATDVTTSAFEAYWQWDTDRPAGRDDNFARVSRLTVAPSIVRIWHGRLVSAYFGGGTGIERQLELNRYRRIVARVNLHPVVADTYTELQKATLLIVPFVVRGGMVVDVGGGLSLRVSYLTAIRYFDEPSARSLDVGLGYRFRRGSQ